MDPLAPGSRLDANHPQSGVLIPCKFTASRDISVHHFRARALPEPERLASVLCDFVVEPTPHGLTNANMAKIVEHCFRQPFVIAQIEQPPRGVI